MNTRVIIIPRSGVTALDIKHFLVVEFQQPGTTGTPLVNADIKVDCIGDHDWEYRWPTDRICTACGKKEDR
jgi:hypothetical protein